MRTLIGDWAEDDLVEHLFGDLVADLANDTASIQVPEGMELLVSADALQEGVHFLLESPPDLVGEKAVRSNVSDIAASGGTPKWLTLTLGLPQNLKTRWLERMIEGMRRACAETGVVLAGGDTSASLERLSISVTVMGLVPAGRTLSRAGAQPGDLIAVTGFLGDSAIGLEMILGRGEGSQSERKAWVTRHFRPPFRAHFSREIAPIVTAMMDLSDGLATDLPRLCRSSGTGADIDLDTIPVSPGGRVLGLRPEQAVLGGEDYELMFTINPDHRQSLTDLARRLDVPVTLIGTIRKGYRIRYLANGNPISLSHTDAWSHFKKNRG